MTSNRLLVIDDEPASSAIIGRIARGCGYDATITTDPDDFRLKFIASDPTVLVLDLSMPEMNGKQVMAWLAKHDCRAQILIVSGHDMDRLQEAQDFGHSLGLNMAGILQKPMRAEELRVILREIYEAVGVLSIQDISNALKNREIRLVYQPQIDLQSGNVIGFEALARWDHPSRGPIPPSIFIPMMETNAIMNEFTSRILELALDDLYLWDGTVDARVAINVSASNCGSMGIDELVRSQCIAKGVGIDRIQIEITETAAMTEASQVGACLVRLHDSGVQLSIDDFGTGYSSLVKLHQLPFSELKIDISFVADCVTNLESSVLVRAMIDLAHGLNKKVVAEGIETEDTLHLLREWGCDVAQGYFIGRPMPPEQVQPWLLHRASLVG